MVVKYNIPYYYSILIEPELFNYLNNTQKLELILTCKFIYQKTKKFSCNELILNFSKKPIFNDYYNIKNIFNNDQLTTRQLDYFNLIEKNYRKDYPRTLVINLGRYYCKLLEFTKQFSNIVRLEVRHSIIDKANLQQFFNNFPNLKALTLHQIFCCYPSIDNPPIKFKFQNNLKKLVINGCYQIKCNTNDPVSLNQLWQNFSNLPLIDLNINSDLITSLKSLSLINKQNNINTSMVNRFLENNLNLKEFEGDLQYLNRQSFLHICNNQNLTNLSLNINGSLSEFIYDNTILLPNIKNFKCTINSRNTNGKLTQLINNFPNLEHFEFNLVLQLQENFFNNFCNLTKLKSIKIKTNSLNPITLQESITKCNLEYIELCSFNPIELNFNVFINLRNLKRVRLVNSSNFLSPQGTAISFYKDLKGWRVLTEGSSIDCWKLK